MPLFFLFFHALHALWVFLKCELRISLAVLFIIVSPSEAEVSDVDIGMKL